MKKTIKEKTLSLLTSATMVLSLCTLPISVQAEEHLTEKEKISLLASNGMLIKRPILVNNEKVLIGFKEKEWIENLINK